MMGFIRNGKNVYLVFLVFEGLSIIYELQVNKLTCSLHVKEKHGYLKKSFYSDLKHP